MIRTAAEYLDSIRDGRQVWINGEKVDDVPTHPMFKPLVDVRARIYDMQHDVATRQVMTYEEDSETFAVGLKLPRTQGDWNRKREATDAVMDDVGGIVTRVGDETVGEMWSLYDGQDVLNEVDPQFSKNIRDHVDRVISIDPFHVSANTDPKGDRSKAPQDQDPDMLLHVVRETDQGIVVRGAKYETAAPYANQAFTKPTIANWGDSELSDYAVGFICDLGSPGIKMISVPDLRGAHQPRIIRSLTSSMKSMRWWYLITFWFHGKTCCSTVTRKPPPSFGQPCTDTARLPSSNAICGWQI